MMKSILLLVTVGILHAAQSFPRTINPTWHRFEYKPDLTISGSFISNDFQNTYKTPERFARHLRDPVESTLFEIQNERVVGGQEATRKQFPYQVGLSLKGRSGSSWCGGSLMSDQFVITVAHCLSGYDSATVIIGAHERTKDSEPGRVNQIVPKANFIIHKKHDKEMTSNDIALIRLQEKVTFTDQIQPIALPTKYESFEGETAIVSGWGRYHPKKKLSPVLLYAETLVASDKVCKKYFPKYYLSSNICQDGSKGIGICNGDSGGPMAIKGKDGKPVLIGLTSFGPTSCYRKRPNVFTRVTSYLKWISEKTGMVIG